jgi:hypothetical protein
MIERMTLKRVFDQLSHGNVRRRKDTAGLEANGAAAGLARRVLEDRRGHEAMLRWFTERWLWHGGHSEEKHHRSNQQLACHHGPVVVDDVGGRVPSGESSTAVTDRSFSRSLL